MSFLYLTAAVLCDVVGTTSLRMASHGRRIFYVPVVLAFPAALWLLLLTLREGMGLGVAYGIWAAGGVALTALVSRWVFKERITRTMALGMGLICAGVLAIEAGAH